MLRAERSAHKGTKYAFVGCCFFVIPISPKSIPKYFSHLFHFLCNRHVKRTIFLALATGYAFPRMMLKQAVMIMNGCWNAFLRARQVMKFIDHGNIYAHTARCAVAAIDALALIAVRHI